MLPRRHPCHTRDPCEMVSPNFHALNDWACIDWPPQETWELRLGTPCEPMNGQKPTATYQWTGRVQDMTGSFQNITGWVQKITDYSSKSLEINPRYLSRRSKSRKIFVNRP
jgi:hypothetical protein